jgi:hypothetical protein
MHVTITGMPRKYDYTTENKVTNLVLPFVQALRSAYIEARISDDESATVDLLADILVYATRVEGTDLQELADRAVRSAAGELYDAEQEREA